MCCLFLWVRNQHSYWRISYSIYLQKYSTPIKKSPVFKSRQGGLTISTLFSFSCLLGTIHRERREQIFLVQFPCKWKKKENTQKFAPWHSLEEYIYIGALPRRTYYPEVTKEVSLVKNLNTVPRQAQYTKGIFFYYF